MTTIPFDIAAWANREIAEFVQRKPNLRLLPGTGFYSTPFRGTLFGESESNKVAHRLTTRRVDALWLGTNPGVKDSLNAILKGRAGRGRFPSFEYQLRSGLFGSARWDDDGTPCADFSPLQKPKHRWRIYHDVLENVFGSTHSCAMANVIPWGSGNIDDFVRRLDAKDSDLLRRVVVFADEVNRQIIRTLKPRLLLAHFSIAERTRLDRVHALGVAMSGVKYRTLTKPGQIRVCAGTYRSDGFITPIVYAPHPASLWISAESARQFVGRLHRIVAKLLAA